MFKENGNFDESFSIAADYEMLIRALKTSGPLYMPGTVVAGMQLGGLSTDSATSFKALRECKRARLKNNAVLHDTPGWFFIYCKAWVKYIINKLLGDNKTKRMINIYRKLTRRQPIWFR